MSLPVAAETTEYAGAPTELFGKVSDLLTAFDTPASEALLLAVFILLVLAVIVHKPKAPFGKKRIIEGQERRGRR